VTIVDERHGRYRDSLGRGPRFPRAALAVVVPIIAIFVAGAGHADQASASEGVGTFGSTTVGTLSASLGANRKLVNRYPLPREGSVSKLSIYLTRTTTSGQEVLRGLVYADTGSLDWRSVRRSAPWNINTHALLCLHGASWWCRRFARWLPRRRRRAGLNPNHDPSLAAVGDIACPSGDTTDECQQLATANLTVAQHPTAVAVLGDNQYQSGLLSEYQSPGAYNDTWGQFNSIVHPTPGNHEYAASSTASGYFTYFGSSAGTGYYSYDLGAWHILSLNSNCSDSGCQALEAGTTSSAEVSWLQGDLAAHPNQCILAYWHHPRFSSGYVGSSPGVAPFWNTLYAAHADVVLNGHDHLYERFAQQDPLQSPTSQGIREFVVGTGGQELDSTMGRIEPNTQLADIHHFGVLFLTLHPGSYDWVFRATSGMVLDSGSTTCHG
jgi:acid phosphatase type 7